VLKKRKVEDHGDFILGPVSPKEYKETVAELNGSRTNRVFEFFKVAALKETCGACRRRRGCERNCNFTAHRSDEEKRQEKHSRRCRHRHRRRESPEETWWPAGGLTPSGQENPSRGRQDRRR
jgi:radical SAM protein with 4Fe4S-binding SPASM domain